MNDNKCRYGEEIKTCYFGSVFGCSDGKLCDEFKTFLRGDEK